MINNNTTENYISQIVLPPIESNGDERLYLIKDKKAQNNIETLQSNLTSLNEELDTLNVKVNNIYVPDISTLVTKDNLNNTVSNFITKTELDNSYVKWSTLNSNYSTNSVLNNTYAHITAGTIDNATVDYTDVNNLYNNYAHIDNNNTIDNASINYTNIDNLYNNYAHINNGTIDNANINQANVNDLNTNYAHITNGTIDNASINYTDINNLNSNYAHINNGVIDNATIDNTNVNNLDTNYAHITSGIIDNATIDQANVNDLNTNYAHIINGKIDNATIDQANVENLNANYAHINNGVIDNANISYANINDLESNYAHINNGIIDNATINQANINDLNTNYAHISRGVIDNASINCENVNYLDSHYAHISEGIIDNATISQANVDQLDAFYAEIDMANVNNAWIENGVIKDAAISDAKIIGISANKITAGTIDASNVNVANLRADNLIVTRINGQPVIGGYTLVHSSISNYLERNPSQEGWYEFSNNVYTLSTDIVVDETKVYYRSSDSIELYDQATIDGMVDGLNARIDSQIETWTTDAVPTLNNYPAEDWTTNALKQEHIGDICYVINAGNNYDGFTYRFAYDNISQQYMWVLIKDNQVTAALGRLVTAEGKITGLENFESTISTWINQTDQGLETIRNNYTTLSGRVDKTVKSTVQLWFTKANTTAPTAPISVVTNNNATGANSYNQWNLTVPEYNANYPYYYYCWQYTFEDDTTGWSAVIYDRATTETQSTARATSSSLSNYITNNDAALAALQSQVDNQLEIWYGNSNPTNSTQPASSWDSDEKANHVGDLYYNTTDGSAWQWTVNNSTYSWTQIPDSAASAALATAQNAQATADGKRRIFTSTPTVPYDIGDLWVTGNQVKYATVKKTESQSYAAADWSQTATDDTMASANIKSSVQLWYTSNSTTPPNKPYTDGSSSYVNSTSTNGNTWTTVVPLYNSSTPKYHYCYQQQRGDGKYQWTTPVYDDATTTAMAKAQSALPATTFETFEQSTFKDVVDTVDEQSSTITTLTTITENNGLTTSTNITNAVNTVSQTAASNSSKISALTTTLGTNADGTSATNNIIQKVSDIEQDLDGITTRVGKTESALKSTYATSSTIAGTAAKEATIFPIISDFELYTGAIITVKFINSNTTDKPTLNINSTGAKAIKTYSGVDLTESEYKWDAGATMNFVYDGTNWRIQDSTELTRLKNAESSITQTANSITSLVANTATYTAPDGTTQTNTIKSAIQQNADNINLRVEKSGVIAAINASVETNGTSAVKISADKVNIEGATIFSSGRLSQTSLNNTYASINDIPSDLSDLTDNNNIIPSDMSDLTDNNNVIPSDISNLTDNNSIIPSDISDLTDNNNVIPDISGKADQSSAIAEEQLIYIQAVSGTNSINAYPQTATTTSSYWVTQTGESIPSGTPPNSNTGQTPRWTLKRPSYQKNYPVIFTAKQRKTVSGVITCSIPLKDDTLTIIDGGHITTGTIDASQVTVNNIRADSITVGTINGTQITNGAISFDKLDNNVKNDITSAWAAIEKTNEEINLRATKTEMYQSAQPNLTPIGSVDFSNIYNANTNPNGYWHTALNTQNSWFTQLDDGWIHVYINNSEGIENINNLNFNPDACPSIIPGNTYTILTEIRNNDSLGTDESNTNFYLNEVNNNQFWGNVQNEQIDDEYVTTTTNVNLLTCGQMNSLYSYRLADVSHIANINEAKVDSGIVGRAIVISDDNSSSQNNNNNASPILFNYIFQCAAGSVLDFDFRMSLYDGIYSGPYKPYSGPQLYSSQAELKVQADRIGMIVANDNAESSLQLTSDALTYIGDNIEIKSPDGTSTVISGGNIQTGSINIGSLDPNVTTSIENAATTATNYISPDNTNGGIRIADANPSERTTYQHQTANETEFVVNGVSRTLISGDGLRIGDTNESHVVIDNMSQTFYDGNQNEVFKIKSGYIEEESMSEAVAVIDTPTDRITDPDALYIYRIEINDTALSDEDWTVLDDGKTVVFTSTVSGDIHIYYSGPSGAVYYQAPQVVIGDDNGKNHMYLDYQTMQMIDSAGNAYFNISNPSSSSGLMRMGYATGNRVEVTANGVATRSGSSNNYTLVDSTGFKAYLSNALRMLLDGTALKVYDGSGTAAANVLASFGSSGGVVGKPSGFRTVMNSSGIDLYNSSNSNTVHIDNNTQDSYQTIGGSITFNPSATGGTSRISGATNGQFTTLSLRSSSGNKEGEIAIEGSGTAIQTRMYAGSTTSGNTLYQNADGFTETGSGSIYGTLDVIGSITTYSTLINDGASFLTRTNAVNHNTTLSEDTPGTGIYFRESSGSDNIGYIRAYGRSGADRKRGLQIGGHNYNNIAWNMLYLLTDKDGKRYVQISEAKPWCDAFGLGTVKTESPSAVSVASSSYVTLGTITLAAGVWVVSISATFESNGNGRRAVYFGTTSTASDINVDQSGSATLAPAVGGMTKFSTSTIESIDSSTTFYCRAWQNSGSALSCRCYLRAVRVGRT